MFANFGARRPALHAVLRRRATPALVSLVDQGVVSGFSFLTGIATARFLDIAAFGRFALAMIVVGLAQSVHNALVTAPMMTIIGRRPREQPRYDASLVAWAVILSLAGGVAGALILAVLFHLRGETSCEAFLVASGAVTSAQNLQFTLRRLLFARASGFKALGMDAARGAVFPIVAVAYKLAGGSITVGALLSLLAATALVTTLPLLRPLRHMSPGRLHLGTVARRHIPLARWLLPVVIVTFGQEQVVWIIAGGVLGDQATGGLRAAQYVVGLVLLFLSATENIIPVRAGRAFAEGGHKGLRHYLVSIGVALGGPVLVLLLAIALSAPLLLKIVFGPAFVPYATCLRVLTLGVAFVFLRDMVAQHFRATQQTGTIFRAFLASLIVSLLVLHPLLAHFGLVGATLVVLIGHITSMIYLLSAALNLGGRLRRAAMTAHRCIMPIPPRTGPSNRAAADAMRAAAMFSPFAHRFLSLVLGVAAGSLLLGAAPRDLGAMPRDLGAAPGDLGARADLGPIVIRVDPRPGIVTARPPAQSFATLDQAIDMVAALRRRWPARPITIDLSPGIHRLARPLRIGPAESGPDMAPLTLRGAPGHRSRIVGSVTLSPAPIALDPALAGRLPDVAKGHVRAYRLPEAALLSPRIRLAKLLRSRPDAVGLDVYDAAGELVPARWPNAGWARVVVGSKDAAHPGFTLEADRMARWRAEPDLWAQGYWRWGWLFESLPVSGVDPDAKRIDLPELPYEGILPGARIRIVHALSELDEPGEWWRDRADGLLLAWPRSHAETLEVAVTDTLLRLENASHVRIEGVTLEQSRGDLVTVQGGSDVLIRDTRLAWAGGRGAVFERARDSGLVDCDIEDIGRVAVRLDGGDRAGLEPGGLFLRDSRLTRFALRSRTQSPAVEIDGVGATVSGNYIHDGMDAALHIHGNDHKILGNEIARLLAGSTDDGAIYAGRDWTARGTLIEGNFLHDIKADPGAEVKGVYLDDEASGFTVRHNLFLRVDQAVFIGGGRDNLVEGNVFIASSPAIHIDSRGQTWAAAAIRDPGSELRMAFAAMPVDSPLWRARYPGLADILLDRPEVAKSNRLERNLIALGQDIHIDDGGEASQQIIRSNAGSARLLSGGNLAALAQGSTDPRDFAGLIDPDGKSRIEFDLGRMRRAPAP